MKLLTTTALALCLSIFVGCSEGNSSTPESEAAIANASNKVEANITGMDCSGCSSSIVAALEAIDGVQAAQADAATGEVVVALTDDADADALKMEISKVIYELQDGKYAIKTLAVSYGNAEPEKTCPAGCTKDCCKNAEESGVIETIEQEVEEVTEDVQDAVKDIQVPSIGE